MRRLAAENRKNRGRLAYDPLDPDRILWCQHVRGDRSRRDAAFPQPIGFRMFALEGGESVRLRYVDDGEYYIMRGEHPRPEDAPLQRAECIVCGATIDPRCNVEMARQDP
jgi:hypothetical protein